MQSIDHIAFSYDRAALRPRILHIGFGAFARAHQLVYLNEALAKGGDWGVVACRLNSGQAELDALDAADHLYHVIEADDHGITARQIGAVCATLHPKRDGTDRLLAQIAQPDLAIISLTITEKGYTLRDGHLDLQHPGVAADLAAPEAPSTAIGVIVAGLAQRRAAGLGGLAIMSCDNLPHNGALARRAVMEFARQRDSGLADWIDSKVTFPSTMIDRIVPALDSDALDLIERATGKRDENSIVAEPFRQWVIEDSFAAGRPAWEEAGAQIVPDVGPYEDMKLRMLNGAHSFLACLGTLSGHRTIADCMNDAGLKRAARRLMVGEQAPTLRPVAGIDLSGYADDLIARFGNSRLHHQTRQIATDSSAKLPQRLIAPAAQHLAADEGCPLTFLGIAAWLRHVRVTVEAGDPLPDPLERELRQIVQDHADGSEFVAAMLALSQVFPAELANDPRFARPVAAAYAVLSQGNISNAIAQTCE
ncbi:mannitol dehydrogenase family protein [Paracoccus seriniphilus]|uniref:Fructuronate reductase n=1 Tax=Paracoccus seriniphilus TaxID=184748 RepID=A0A239PUI3_9RHOB|nr:mannitol dehydrogenase family protein [Paracoccus seriniphilus]WCR16506.1 mannitol dehydrogenase family protein [Paracoccus seriniphilus]SNT73693.1 fructuronate reductase [Paracoccus seriniphilus]